MDTLFGICVALLIAIAGVGNDSTTEMNADITPKTIAVEESQNATITRRPIYSLSEKRTERELSIIHLDVFKWPEETLLETEKAHEEYEDTPDEEYFPLFTVNGHLLDESIQKMLWEELNSNGIGWWMPYAVLTMYQESAFKVDDITNGLDYGILQYRKMYWADKCARYGLPDADIFDVYAQIHVYTQETKKRLLEYGCDIYETISRHKTSDYGSYDAIYVNDVLNHSIEQIR